MSPPRTMNYINTPPNPAADSAPEFLNHKLATKIFGLSRSYLYLLAAEGHIKTVSLRRRGQIKGKRLFVADSIRDYLLQNLVASRAGGAR